MAKNSHRDVFISSTTRDLENHRQAARDAVWRANLFPLMMERDVATMEDPVAYSLRQVDEAEIYIGVFAMRYGYTPPSNAYNPGGLSITELEYRHAMTRDIPVLIFIMSENHPVRAQDVETNPEKLIKLVQLKTELKENHVTGFFDSADDLGNQIFQALQDPKIQLYISQQENKPPHTAQTTPNDLQTHPPYFAHTYIQPHRFVGRKAELNQLDTWARSDNTVMLVRAIGGTGKSALTWEWVNQQVEQPARDFAGIIWWSFYENHSALENFIVHALAYITGSPRESFTSMPRAEREIMLMTELQKTSYLIIFDGIERIMTAYQRIDASHMADDDTDDAYERDLQLRRCTDPRDDELLSRLATARPSKILSSTRLIPQAFTTRQQSLMRGVTSIELGGLRPDDALALMHELGVHGTDDAMSRFLGEFGYHSLLLNIIAGRIASYRPAPGDFDTWYDDEGRQLKLSELDLAQRRTHVLQYALEGLSPELRRLLGHIASFRYPVDYQTLSEVNPFVPDTPQAGRSRSDITSVRVKLHKGLSELEDRGLVLWDRMTNRYDLHPIVRGYAYEQMGENDRTQTFRRMHNHFANLPPEDLDKVERLDDLQSSLELYEVLVRLNRWDDAMDVYDKRLKVALTYKLAQYDKIVELLAPFFADGLDDLPRLSSYRGQNICLTDMATAFSYLGETEKSMMLRGLKIKLAIKQKSYSSMGVGLRTYSSSLRLDQNKLATSLKACQLALEVAEANQDMDNMGISYMYLLSLYRDMGWWDDAHEAYAQFNHLLQQRPALRKWQATTDRFYAEMLIYLEQDATDLLNNIWRDAQNSENKNQVHIREIYRLRAESALQHGQYGTAAGFFLDTITLGQRSGIPVSGLMGRLAYTRACEGLHAEALDILQDALEQHDIKRRHDLFNSAAAVYLRIGDTAQAARYAHLAYESAWADGPPYVWWWRLEHARQILAQLNEPESVLPAYTPDHIEAIPYEAEIRRFIRELHSRT